MERKQFTFYISFFRAIQHIRNKSARADAYDAICAYAFHETKPDLERLPPAAAMAFEAAQPILDAGRRKAQSGAIGGASRPSCGTEAGYKQEQGQGKGKEKDQEQMFYSPAVRRGRERKHGVPYGSAGQGPLGPEEQAALERMLQGAKRDA